LGPEGDGLDRTGHGARNHQFARLAAADLENEAGRQLDPRDGARGIDTTLEAIAGVAFKVQKPSRLGHPNGVEEGGFEYQVRGLRRAAAVLAAHDAAQAEDTRRIRDDAETFGQLVLASVQRIQRLATVRQAHHDIAVELVRVIDMERTGAVEGEVIGDVDKRRNGPEADGAQAILQPLRALAVGDAADEAPGEN